MSDIENEEQSVAEVEEVESLKEIEDNENTLVQSLKIETVPNDASMETGSESDEVIEAKKVPSTLEDQQSAQSFIESTTNNAESSEQEGNDMGKEDIDQTEQEVETELLNQKDINKSIPSDGTKAKGWQPTELMVDGFEDQATEDRTEDQVPDITGTDNADVMVTSMDGIEELPISEEQGAETLASMEQEIETVIESGTEDMKTSPATEVEAPSLDDTEVVEYEEFIEISETPSKHQNVSSELAEEEVQELGQTEIEIQQFGIASESNKNLENLTIDRAQEEFDDESLSAKGKEKIENEFGKQIPTKHYDAGDSIKDTEFEEALPVGTNAISDDNISNLLANNSVTIPKENEQSEGLEILGNSNFSSLELDAGNIVPLAMSSPMSTELKYYNDEGPPLKQNITNEEETNQENIPRKISVVENEISADQKVSSRKTSAAEERVSSRKVSDAIEDIAEKEVPSRKTSKTKNSEIQSSKSSVPEEDNEPFRKASGEILLSRKGSFESDEKVALRQTSMMKSEKYEETLNNSPRSLSLASESVEIEKTTESTFAFQ
ncbi:unnamed protein product [Thelazia callipaeda]|uniref:Ataxin-2 C-terminal domain-containing protein n=1 Tax=Thelazia callipaeda TaxID=103827 RepID=A0A0N5CQ06_THECL|nr:unnamed protein product [Thelazia callipaeda]